MTLRLLNFAPKHWRNGTTFIGRTGAWLIGEKNYDSIRVYKRTVYAEWWYSKQTFYHWLYVNKSDWANFFAMLPKPDSSHGFPWKETPSRYSQFSEDTLSSDGYVGWYTYIWVGLAALWSFFYYFWRRRWIDSIDFLSDNNKERFVYVDGLICSGYEANIIYYWGFWKLVLSPHEFKRFVDERFVTFPPESKAQAISITLNRQNTFYDHYWRGLGKEHEMS